jgi:hypothetical protein
MLPDTNMATARNLSELQSAEHDSDLSVSPSPGISKLNVCMHEASTSTLTRDFSSMRVCAIFVSLSVRYTKAASLSIPAN